MVRQREGSSVRTGRSGCTQLVASGYAQGGNAARRKRIDIASNERPIPMRFQVGAAARCKNTAYSYRVLVFREYFGL